MREVIELMRNEVIEKRTALRLELASDLADVKVARGELQKVLSA